MSFVISALTWATYQWWVWMSLSAIGITAVFLILKIVNRREEQRFIELFRSYSDEKGVFIR